MADETEVTPTPPAVEPSASPAIDMSDYERLKTFHDSYSGFITAAEPYANTVTRVVNDPEFRNLVEQAAKASAALAPPDDTPDWAKKTQEDVRAVREDLDKQKAKLAQDQALMNAQARMLDIGKRYPAIAENDYKIANQIAQEIKDKNIPFDVFIDTVEAVAKILPAPSEQKRPPTSTRADAGVPAVTSTPQETYSNNKERGKAIDKKIASLLKNVK